MSIIFIFSIIVSGCDLSAARDADINDCFVRILWHCSKCGREYWKDCGEKDSARERKRRWLWITKGYEGEITPGRGYAFFEPHILLCESSLEPCGLFLF